MADSPFRGDFAFRRMEEERLLTIKRLRRERRVTVFDLFLSVGGFFACITHLLAPWIVLFQILQIVWTLHLLLVASAISVLWNINQFIVIQHRLKESQNPS